MNEGINAYVQDRDNPWSKLFYRVLWAQLPNPTGIRILDFGSGLGITANHFAENNEVVAIEPNSEMVEMRVTEHGYEQIIGSLEQLTRMNDSSFDMIFCHNVLEYVTHPRDFVAEFCRLVKPGGIISIVKHNRFGRIMQKVVFENNLNEARALLHGGSTHARHFGRVNYFELNELSDWITDMDVRIEKVLGIRAFWGLPQDNEVKKQQSWQDDMFEMEMDVSHIENFIHVSFFQHILLKRVG